MRNRTFGTLLAGLLLLLAIPHTGVAQGDVSPSGENRFLLTGYGFASYTDNDSGESFSAGFTPIFLYRVSDRILFEAELEFDLDGDAVETEVEYAQIDWLAHDRLTVVAGRYLTPFGSFIEKLHPAWINKLPTAPLPYQHGSSLVPFGQTGVQLRGGIPLGDGNKRVTYSLFFSNGFQPAMHGHGEEPPVEGEEHGDDGDDHGEEAEEPGDESEEKELIFLDGSSANGNGDLSIGGRMTIVPAQGLEVGLSYLSGKYDETGQLEATVRGVDLAYHHELFDLRAEWLDSELQRGRDHDGELLPDQAIDSWYIQPSLRLSVIPVYALNKVELVGRLARLDWGAADEEQLSVGFNYYFTSSSILRVAWERREVTGHQAEDAVDLMFAVGF